MRSIRKVIDLYYAKMQPLEMVQNDTTIFIFKLIDNVMAPVNPSRVILQAIRPDDKPLVQINNINITKNIVTILLDPEMVEVPGRIKFELRFPHGETMISSYIFDGDIEEVLIKDVTPMPTPEDIIKLVTSNKVMYIWVGMQHEYDNMVHNDNTLYFIEG